MMPTENVYCHKCQIDVNPSSTGTIQCWHAYSKDKKLKLHQDMRFRKVGFFTRWIVLDSRKSIHKFSINKLWISSGKRMVTRHEQLSCLYSSGDSAMVWNVRLHAFHNRTHYVHILHRVFSSHTRSMIYECSLSCWRHHRTFIPHCSWHRQWWCRRRRRRRHRHTLTIAMKLRLRTHTRTISCRTVWTLVARRWSCLRSRFVIEITV